MRTLRAVPAAVFAALPALALASGDSGTGAVADMQVSKGMLFALLGGMVVLGLVIWGLAKLTGSSDPDEGDKK